MDFFLSPLNLFWMLALLGLILFRYRRRRAGKAVAVTAGVLLFLFSVSPLPVIMGRQLEGMYPVHSQAHPPATMPIVVLGGGHVNDPALPEAQRLGIPALSRLAEGLRQMQLSPGNTLILSGYAGKGTVPQAKMLGAAAISLGVRPSDTLMMVRPATTWDEAREYKHRFGGRYKRLILVTSAAHMNRAIAIFRRNGLEPIPAPTDFCFKADPSTMLYNWWPSSYKLMVSERIIHEYVGIPYYRWIKK